MRKSRATLLLLLTIGGFLLACGSLPHLHASGKPGLWNEEHDLALMATFGADTSHLGAMPLVIPVLIVVAILASAASHPAAEPRRHAASRAPPAR